MKSYKAIYHVLENVSLYKCSENLFLLNKISVYWESSEELSNIISDRGKGDFLLFFPSYLSHKFNFSTINIHCCCHFLNKRGKGAKEKECWTGILYCSTVWRRSINSLKAG